MVSYYTNARTDLFFFFFLTGESIFSGECERNTRTAEPCLWYSCEIIVSSPRTATLELSGHRPEELQVWMQISKSVGPGLTLPALWYKVCVPLIPCL